MSSVTRFLIASVALVLVQTSALANDVDSYQHSWMAQALDLQNDLSLHDPLAQVTFLATHNSYNSSAYTTAGSYWDPNQSRSLRDQLRMDIRALELDVHSYFSTEGWPWEWSKELLLCHGTGDEVGCSTFDRKFSTGLHEIRGWLDNPANSDQVLLIYIEDHIDDGDYGRAIDALRNTLGPYIHRPEGSGCKGIPMDRTKADILESGKQVLLMTDGCQNSAWNSWVYGGVGHRLSGYPTGSIEQLNGFPNCASGTFSRAFHDAYMTRFQEDRTNLTSLFGDPGERLTPTTLKTMMQCGINIPGMDKLTPYDGRLRAAVWSWGEGEPNNAGAGEDCAHMRPDGRWNDIGCGNQYRVACRKPGTHDWTISNQRGRWEDGERICREDTNGQYKFAVPTNGYDNEMLKAQQSMGGAPNIWLNYNDRDQEGQWRANGRP